MGLALSKRQNSFKIHSYGYPANFSILNETNTRTVITLAISPHQAPPITKFFLVLSYCFNTVLHLTSRLWHYSAASWKDIMQHFQDIPSGQGPEVILLGMDKSISYSFSLSNTNICQFIHTCDAVFKNKNSYERYHSLQHIKSLSQHMSAKNNEMSVLRLAKKKNPSAMSSAMTSPISLTSPELNSLYIYYIQHTIKCIPWLIIETNKMSSKKRLLPLLRQYHLTQLTRRGWIATPGSNSRYKRK